ncbi:MAG: hypothetical protein R3D32_11825 [Nitratireductor sp.]
MSWLSRHSPAIEAVAAMITAAVAVAALIGVKIQLDGADRIQREQSAREAYRAHLALAATLPQFAEPADGCQLMKSDQGGAYAAFVDHLLYSAEQMLTVSEGWDETFLEELEPHRDYLCLPAGRPGETAETTKLLLSFRSMHCASNPVCQ